MDIEKKYFVKTLKVPGEVKKDVTGREVKYGDELDVSIYQRDEAGGEIKIGEYRRRYSSMLRTFYPFMQDEKEYAMFSKSASGIHVMELPSCKQIADQPEGHRGFCPVEFYIPYNPASKLFGHFGFLSGCVWGDDNSWKIRYLDLSQIKNGIVKQDGRFGYIKQLDLIGERHSRSLKDSIEIEYETTDPNPVNHDYRVFIKAEMDFDLRTGEKI